MNDETRDALHSLLMRQLRKLGIDADSLPAGTRQLLNAVSETYKDQDKDRTMLERSMEISSKELLRSNSEMRAIISGLPDMLYRIERNGDVVDLNSRQILCNITSPDSNLAAKMHGETDAETNGYLLDVVRRALDERQGNTVDYSFDNAATTCYEMRLAPLMDGSLIAIIRDISDIRKIATKLEHARDLAEAANKSKSLFLANMSHEVRTPISGITGMTELLQKTDLDQHQQSLLDMLNSSSRNLLTIIDDILDISRAEVSGLRLHKADFSLLHTIEATVEQVMSASGSRSGRVRVAIDENVPDLVNGDEARISQIMINLLANAVKFSKEDSVVILEVSASSNEQAVDLFELRLDVIDEGIGIQKCDLDTIFRPFFQLEQSSMVPSKGVGLGLSITKRLVELMQGRVLVDSRVGKGSRFTVLLPLLSVDSELKADKASVGSDAAGLLKPGKILVAEDNPVNQTHIRYLLTGLGMDVTIVENGQQAVDKFLDEDFHLVLMDCRMPVLDGWEATREIRRHEMRAGTEQPLPVLALTAHAMKGDRAVCIDAGMTDYLSKPVDEQQLIEILRTYIG